MTLRAPEDRKRPEARLNWFLAQLKSSDPKNVDIVAHWPGRTRSTMAPLGRVREDGSQLLGQANGLTPYAFEVVYNCHTPVSFLARKRFLQDLDTAIQHFYGNIGRHLTAWAAKAPAPQERTAAETIEEASAIDAERRTAESLALVLQSLGQDPAASGQEPEPRPGEQSIASPVGQGKSEESVDP